MTFWLRVHASDTLSCLLSQSWLQATTAFTEDWTVKITPWKKAISYIQYNIYPFPYPSYSFLFHLQVQQTAWARTQNISETKNGNQVTQVQCLPKWHIAQDCLCIVHSFPKIVTAKDATRPHLGQKCGHISTTLFAWKKKHTTNMW